RAPPGAGGRASPARRQSDPSGCGSRRRAAQPAGGAPPDRPASPRTMIVHVDTSALVDALTGPRRSLDEVERLVSEGHRLMVSAIVLYEWWRGPRTQAELAAQQELFPAETAVPFSVDEAAVAARLYRSIPKARGR